MRIFEWNLEDGFDYLCVTTNREAKDFTRKILSTPVLSTYSEDGDYYFLISLQARLLTTPPSLDYIFGCGQPPYGSEIFNVQIDPMRLKWVPFEQMQLSYTQDGMGVAIADIVGSRFVIRQAQDNLDMYDLYDSASSFSHISILYGAALEAMSKICSDFAPDWIEYDDEARMASEKIRQTLRYYGDLYPLAGYPDAYQRWLYTYKARPYESDSLDELVLAAAAGLQARSAQEARALAKVSLATTNAKESMIKAAEYYASTLYALKTNEHLLEKWEQTKVHKSAPVKLVRSVISFVFSCSSFEEVLLSAIMDHQSVIFCALACALAEQCFSVPSYLKKKAAVLLAPALACAVYAGSQAAAGSFNQ